MNSDQTSALCRDDYEALLIQRIREIALRHAIPETLAIAQLERLLLQISSVMSKLDYYGQSHPDLTEKHLDLHILLQYKKALEGICQ